MGRHFKNREEYEKWRAEHLPNVAKNSSETSDNQDQKQPVLTDDMSSSPDNSSENKNQKEKVTWLSSKLKTCKDCGNQVSKNADKCPTCGAPVKWKPPKIGCLGILFLFLILGYFYHLGTSSKNQEPVTSEAPIERPRIEKSEDAKPYSDIPIEIHEDIREVAIAFKKLTKLQQKEWAETATWRVYVTGNGLVSQVEDAGILSEIKGEYYEVTVELQGGNRAVVSYPKNPKYHWVRGLSKGTTHEFKGRLKTVKDWGFWVSGYVMGES